jgi:hypothetical protein
MNNPIAASSGYAQSFLDQLTRNQSITISSRSCGNGPLNFYLEVIGVEQAQQLQQVVDLAIDQWKQKVSPLS